MKVVISDVYNHYDLGYYFINNDPYFDDFDESKKTLWFYESHGESMDKFLKGEFTNDGYVYVEQWETT